MVEAPIDLVSDSDEEGGPEPIDVEAAILGPVLAAARPVKTEPGGEQQRPAAAVGGPAGQLPGAVCWRVAVVARSTPKQEGVAVSSV